MHVIFSIIILYPLSERFATLRETTTGPAKGHTPLGSPQNDLPMHRHRYKLSFLAVPDCVLNMLSTLTKSLLFFFCFVSFSFSPSLFFVWVSTFAIVCILHISTNSHVPIKCMQFAALGPSSMTHALIATDRSIKFHL